MNPADGPSSSTAPSTPAPSIPGLGGAAPGMPPPRTLFGHPAGLATLFLTEMWERFTHYGMRAILVLFMVAGIAEGGLGLDDRTANAVYGLFVAASYLLSLLGGWIADRLIGAERAVIAGAMLITAGNGLLVSGRPPIFFSGLTVIAFGVGLLKPNVSALVARLYPEGGARRDAGFSLFYMGINVGALLGPVLVSIAAARWGWHAGFALPAVGMLLGLGQFLGTRRYLGAAERTAVPPTLAAWRPVLALLIAGALLVALIATGILRLDAPALARASSALIGLLAAGYFLYLLTFAGLEPAQRTRVYVMIALFVAATVYYAGQEQTGTSLTLFAERHTERHWLGVVIPAGMFQAVSPVYILLLAPLFSALWIGLGRSGRDPSTPFKFAIALALMGAGFLVMACAALEVHAGARVSPGWLLACYFVQMCGDLCLGPVGLSSMTKLAPPRFVGQVMGMWFLSIALGDNLAGLLAGGRAATALSSLPGYFMTMFGWGIGAGAVLLALSPILRRWTAGVR